MCLFIYLIHGYFSSPVLSVKIKRRWSISFCWIVRRDTPAMKTRTFLLAMISVRNKSSDLRSDQNKTELINSEKYQVLLYNWRQHEMKNKKIIDLLIIDSGLTVQKMNTAVGVNLRVVFCVCVCVCRSTTETRRLAHAEQTWEEEAGEEVYGGVERYGWRFTCTGKKSHRHDAAWTEVQKTHVLLIFSFSIHLHTFHDDFHCT